MKRLKTLVSCCVATALTLVGLTGCSSQESYTPPEKSPVLSTPAVGKEGTLRVGLDMDNAPFSAQPQGSSKTAGIDVDVAAALADSLGLKLEMVDVGSDPESALESNKVDVVVGVKKSDSDATFWKSDPYLETSVALFASSSSASVPTESSSPEIAAQVSSTSSWAVTNEFGDSALTPTNDLKSAFSSLESGEVEYVAADAVIGTYAAKNAGNEASIIALLQQPSGYCVGVLDSNTDLKQAISEAVASLVDNGIISVIETKWLGTALDLSNVPLTATAKSSSSSSSASTGSTNGDSTDEETADVSTSTQASNASAGGNASQTLN